MREILFRGKCLHNNEWFEGESFLKSNAFTVVAKAVTLGVNECGIVNAICKSVFHAVDPATVGQFTEQTDKNGKRIFEGDIVKEKDVVHNGEIQIPGHIFTVVMRKGCWCVIPPNDADQWDFLNSYARLIEVIGNIHDNPELLEVSK